MYCLLYQLFLVPAKGMFLDHDTPSCAKLSQERNFLIMKGVRDKLERYALDNPMGYPMR